MESGFYELTSATAQGERLAMSELNGKVVLIVNTATKCGLAPQLEGLEKLHKQYKDQGLVVMGFPCNQFAGQEPETNETMEHNCFMKFNVTFPLMAKCDVNGPSTHPVFEFLKSNTTGLLGSRIKWNFTKFLVDRNGKAIGRYSPLTKPETLENAIQKLL
jgi:glutathione peroxidase